MNIINKIMNLTNSDEALMKEDMTNYFLLDVRTPEEFNHSHISNSKLIPMEEIPNNLERLKKTKKTILIICRSGVRATSVKNYLNQNKITNTKVLEGGIMANEYLLNKD